MIEIFKIALPVFLLIGVGYIASYRQAFTFIQANVLMRFAIAVSIVSIST